MDRLSIKFTPDQLDTLIAVCNRAKLNLPGYCDGSGLATGKSETERELFAKLKSLRNDRKKEFLDRAKAAAKHLKSIKKSKEPLTLPASSLNFLADLCCWMPESDGLSSAAMEVAREMFGLIANPERHVAMQTTGAG